MERDAVQTRLRALFQALQGAVVRKRPQSGCPVGTSIQAFSGEGRCGERGRLRATGSRFGVDEEEKGEQGKRDWKLVWSLKRMNCARVRDGEVARKGRWPIRQAPIVVDLRHAIEANNDLK